MEEDVFQRHTGAEDLHDSIQKGDVERVTKLINDRNGEIHFCNSRNESAVRCALKNKHFEIYERLIVAGLRLGPHENFSEILSKELFHNLRRIREINISSLTRTYDKNLLFLLKKTRISYLNKEIRVNPFDIVRHAYEELDEVKEISPILKVVAASADLKIIFDFDHTTVSNLDPTKDSHVIATTYLNEKHIFIAAKNLLEVKDFSSVLGTLAHELTHFALHLVYDNDCKPYQVHDEAREEKFEEIIANCTENRGFELLIDRAFLYSRSKWCSELIVRVPHVLASYKNDQEKLKSIENKFSALFDFYQNETLVDLENEVSLIEASQIISEINTSSVTFDAISKLKTQLKLEADCYGLITNETCHYVTNCPILTMKAIQGKLQVKSKRSLAVFITCQDLQNNENVEKICKAKELRDDTRVVLDCNEIDNEENLKKSLKIMNENGLRESLISVSHEDSDIGKYSCDLSITRIFHKFFELTDESQEDILKKEVTFHSEKFALEKLVDKSSVNNFKHFPLNDLLSGKKVKIKNKKSDSENRFQIERKFLAQRIEDQEDELTLDEVIEHQQDKKIRIISDLPGTGKSEALKAIAMKLKRKYPTVWVLPVNMKFVCKRFSKEKSFESLDETLDFFCELIGFKNKFSSEVFRHLFVKDRVIILVDGLDQISLIYKSFFEKLVSSVQITSNNQLWVVTRPRFARKLMQFLNFVCFKLKPLEIEDCMSLVDNHFKFSKAENIKEQIWTVKKIIQSLNQKQCFSPLLIRFICEVFVEDSLEINSFSLFKKVSHKMIGNCVQKDLEANECVRSLFIINLSLEKVCQMFAVKLLFKESDLNCFPNEKEIFEENKQIYNEFLTRMGLLSFSDTKKELEFTNEIFAEYFVANFFHEKFFTQNFSLLDNKGAIFHLVVESLKSNSTYSNIKNFVNSSLESFCSNSKVLEIREEYSKKTYLNFLRNEMNIHELVENRLMNLISYLTFGSRRENFKLWFSLDEEQQNVMIAAANFLSPQEIKIFCEHAINMFGIKNFEKLLDMKSLEEILATLKGRGMSETIVCLFCFLIGSLKVGENLMNEANNLVIVQDQKIFPIFTRRSDKRDLIVSKQKPTCDKKRLLIKPFQSWKVSSIYNFRSFSLTHEDETIKQATKKCMDLRERKDVTSFQWMECFFNKQQKQTFNESNAESVLQSIKLN